jgi:hypothetical protein
MTYSCNICGKQATLAFRWADDARQALSFKVNPDICLNVLYCDDCAHAFNGDFDEDVLCYQPLEEYLIAFNELRL